MGSDTYRAVGRLIRVLQHDHEYRPLPGYLYIAGMLSGQHRIPADACLTDCVIRPVEKQAVLFRLGPDFF